MKILVLIDAWFPFVGGAQIQIKNLKKILAKKYQVKYFILHAPSTNILIRLLWSFWVIPRAILLNKQQQFDLIHAHAYWPGIPGKILAKILRIPIIFTIHGSNLLDLNKKSILATLEKIILTKIKYNWVISVSTNFLKHQNINKKITVIPNGVDIKKFKSLKVKRLKSYSLSIYRPRQSVGRHSPITPPHRRTGIHQSPITRLLFVGRLEKIKGIDYLIKAFKKAVKEAKKIKLIIVGKGREEKNLKKLANILNISNKVKFAYYKKRNSLIKEYLKADVFVLPSLAEGQPLTLLEAWAAKLPVIATNVGDNSKMIKNGYNGYLAKPKNVNSLAKTIIKALKNKNRKILGQRGFNLVKNNYTWQLCGQKTYEVYKKNI